MGVTRKKVTGFTLIELLVVVIIVAILAAVGVPLLRGNVDRAKGSEAEAALGTIRTAMRAFLAEHGSYTGATMVNIGLNLRTAIPAAAVSDLDGHFYSEEAYAVTVTGGGTTFCAHADGSASLPANAPKAGEVSAIDRAINEQGTIVTTIPVGC